MLKQVLSGAAVLATVGGGALASVPAQAATLKGDACSVSVGASRPADYTYEHVYVHTGAGYTHVRLTFHYRTTTPYATVETGQRGYDTYARYISGATPGYRVSVTGKVTSAPSGRKTGATCSTAFTPVK